jgi:thymidylate synthase
MIRIVTDSVDRGFQRSVAHFMNGITYTPPHTFLEHPTDEFRLRTTTDPSSPDRGKTMLEYGLLLEIENPIDRLIYTKPVDIFNLVGLWTYILRGSSSLPEIEFYNPMARKFIDEEVSVVSLRGNWGERLFGSGGVTKIVNLLRTNPHSRRAYLPVFTPDDLGYESRNLPCLVGCQFTVSGVFLEMYVTMRAQAAVGVFPYDLFVLTMLQEYVAVRLGLEVGRYVHFAPFFGVREHEIAQIQEISILNGVAGSDYWMPRMPLLEPGQRALFLECEKRARRGNEETALLKQLPDYYLGLLSVTRTRRLYVAKDPAWEEAFASAALAFPMSFLKQCYLRLSAMEKVKLLS